MGRNFQFVPINCFRSIIHGLHFQEVSKKVNMIDNYANIVNTVQNLLIFDIQFYVMISILTNNDETKNDDGKQGFEAWRITSTAFF